MMVALNPSWPGARNPIWLPAPEPALIEFALQPVVSSPAPPFCRTIEPLLAVIALAASVGVPAKIRLISPPALLLEAVKAPFVCTDRKVPTLPSESALKLVTVPMLSPADSTTLPPTMFCAALPAMIEPSVTTLTSPELLTERTVRLPSETSAMVPVESIVEPVCIVSAPPATPAPPPVTFLPAVSATEEALIAPPSWMFRAAWNVTAPVGLVMSPKEKMS